MINITEVLFQFSIISSTSLPEITSSHASIKKYFSSQSRKCKFSFHSVSKNDVPKVSLIIDDKNLT